MSALPDDDCQNSKQGGSTKAIVRAMTGIDDMKLVEDDEFCDSVKVVDHDRPAVFEACDTSLEEEDLGLPLSDKDNS